MQQPPPAYAALGVSVVVHAVALGAYLHGWRAAAGLNDIDLQFYSLIGVSAVLSLATFVSREQVVFRILWIARLVLCLALLHRFSDLVAIRALLLASYALDAGVYAGYPTGAVLQGVALAASVVVFDLASLVRDPSMWPLTALYYLPVAVVAVVASFFTAYREELLALKRQNRNLDTAVTQLSGSNVALQEYAFHSGEESRLEERHRVSRDLHDIVGHTMTNLVMMMEAATDLVLSDPERVEAIMQSARDLARDGQRDTRRALYDLRGREERPVSCIAAVRKLVSAYRTLGSLEVGFELLSNLPESFGPDVDAAVYHLIQEGLTNAIRHGRASVIRVIMFRTDAGIAVSVCDNGIGASGLAEGIGFTGMRERLTRAGGTLVTASTAAGFELTAGIPFPGLAARGGSE